VRLALGATSQSVVALVIGRSLLLGVAGVALGAAGSDAAGRMIQTMLFGVSPFDTLTVTGVGVLLLAVSAGAAYLPARRAGKVDPLVALRVE
jgi:ABC-type antimicrobial peptide transport system permease subunit